MAAKRGPSARPYYPSLDGLRCLAIVPIVWHHSTTHPMDGVLGRGPLGVDLFFAVSGFLITSLLLHERATSQPAGISLGRFWIRRSLRIFPLYYFVLAAFVVHAVFVRPPGPSRDYFLHTLPYYATYTSNWLYEPVGHPIVFAFAWSLATEEQFYLVWPPILRVARGPLVPALVMAILIAIDQGAERGWLEPILGNGLALAITRSFATPIGLGALLALAAHARHPLVTRACDAVVGHRWSSVIALAFVAVALVRPWPLFPTHVALAMLVFACAHRRDHVLAPLLENRVVQHVGAVSYGIYLFNVPVVTAVRSVLDASSANSAILVFVVSLAVCVVVATLSHRWLELPFLRLRDRFRGPPTRSAQP